MSQPSLDERVTLLEQEVAILARMHPDQSAVKDKNWRSTVGMFADDPVMKEIIEAGHAIREQDREQSGE